MKKSLLTLKFDNDGECTGEGETAEKPPRCFVPCRHIAVEIETIGKFVLNRKICKLVEMPVFEILRLHGECPDGKWWTPKKHKQRGESNIKHESEDLLV